MKAKCSVTFEFNSRTPVSWQGEVEGASAPNLTRKAVDKANKELKPRGWTSVTCIILEREGIVGEAMIKEEDVPLPLEYPNKEIDHLKEFPPE